MQWRDGYNIHLIPIEGSDAKELIIEVCYFQSIPRLQVRLTGTQAAEDCPAIIDTVEPRGFHTKDTWLEHPERPGWWCHAGRMDDITVLSNGEKTNNKQLGKSLRFSVCLYAPDLVTETILLHDHRFRHVLVFGQGRPQNGLLVDPAPDTQDLKTFLDDVWPTIVAMNKEVPLHSRLVRELVLVAQPDRPFALTDKGTVRGKITLTLYGKEIEQAYRNIEENTSSSWEIPAVFNVDSIKVYLAQVIEDVLGRKINQSDDLFAQGLFDTYFRT